MHLLNRNDISRLNVKLFREAAKPSKHPLNPSKLLHAGCVSVIHFCSIMKSRRGDCIELWSFLIFCAASALMNNINLQKSTRHNVFNKSKIPSSSDTANKINWLHPENRTVSLCLTSITGMGFGYEFASSMFPDIIFAHS